MGSFAFIDQVLWRQRHDTDSLEIIGVDGDEHRLAMSKRMGADVTLDYREVEVVAEVKRLTGGGADVAIEALGTQQTFESALRSLRPAGSCPVSAFTQASFKFRMRHSRPALEINES